MENGQRKRLVTKGETSTRRLIDSPPKKKTRFSKNKDVAIYLNDLIKKSMSQYKTQTRNLINANLPKSSKRIFPILVQR